ncbi:MAG: hypothetical protein ACRBB3_08130 [Alphaproteobacteria bacterium]
MHDVDDFLRGRDVPPMRSNLEHRILQASLSANKNTYISDSNGLLDVFLSIMGGVLLPRPLLSMSLVLVSGFVIGGYYSGGYDNNISVDEFFLSEDEAEYGGLL